jgi:hypothetical protein
MMLKLEESGFVRFRNIQTFLNCRILSLKDLEEHLPGSILVAIDIESSAEEGVSEIGIALFPAMKQTPELCSGIQSFYEAHEIRAETFRVRERTFHRRLTEPKQFGNTVVVDSEDKIGQRIEEILLYYKSENKPIVLVGFDLNTEFRWISHVHPSLIAHFSAWIDTQDAVSEQFSHSRQKKTITYTHSRKVVRLRLIVEDQSKSYPV